MPPTPSAYDTSANRYSRDQLLHIYRSQDPEQIDVASLFLPGWKPGHLNGGAARSWGKPNDAHPQHDPTVCWDTNGNMMPLGLQEMSQEEKEVRISVMSAEFKRVLFR